MPEAAGEINGNKINGNTQIVLNLKAISIIIGIILSIGGSIFGVINSKLSKLSTEINTLEEKVEIYNKTATSVQAQNIIILQHYGIDIEIDAEEAARLRQENNGRPSSLTE